MRKRGLLPGPEPQPQDLFGGGGNIFPGGIRVHGIGKAHGSTQHRKDGVDLSQGRVGLDTACQGNDRDPLFPGKPGHRGGRLAHGSGPHR